MAIVDDVGLLCLIIDGSDGHEIAGRTRLQKIAYFCRRLGWDIRDYKLHYYGPFSFALADTVETAESVGLIRQSSDVPHLFSLTGEGSGLVRRFKEGAGDARKVEDTQALARRLSGWDARELELAATIDFVQKNEQNLEKAELLDKVGRIKENFSPDQILDAYGKWKGLMGSIRPG